MTLLHSSLLLIGCLTGLPEVGGAGGAVQAENGVPRRNWETIVLPAGFSLDLESGVVVSRPGDNRATVTFTRGRLSSDLPLRLLGRRDGGSGAHFSRDGGDAISGATAAAGQELIFDLYGEAWGLLRILRSGPTELTVELVFEPNPGLRELVRTPANLTASSGPGGVTLQWPVQGGGLYKVERRRLAAGANERDGRWNEVARVGGAGWVDEEISLARLSEYRVSLLGAAGGFGASAIGVPGMESGEVRTQLGPGSELNLLCALDDGLRADLLIESVRSNGVQISPGEGVLARMLTLDEEQNWVLDEITASGYHNQRFFLPEGRVLALRTPEGIHCLLRVEEVSGGFALVSRQLDLTGKRLFPPRPSVPQARWEQGRGVVFRFTENVSGPPGAQTVFVVERERVFDGGDWGVCVVGGPDELELVDGDIEGALLVRYRFRQGLDRLRLSGGSATVTVLVGGESPGARHELLQRAIQDLGAEDYAKREQARGVLLALGEGAWPLLREALRSGNAELATNARDLLVRGLKEMEGEDEYLRGGLARLLLSIRAEELGLEGAPHPDWTSRTSGVRALASLSGTGWRTSSAARVSAWRRVLAEADPDKGVQLAAGLASLLESDGFGPDLRSVSERRSSSGQSFEGSRRLNSEPQIQPLELSFPWSALVKEQARFDLEGARWGTGEEAALAQERLVLANQLTGHFSRTQDELFLDCALRLVQDPAARLKGALAFARSRRGAQGQETAKPWRRVRLAAPDTELLRAELELMNERVGEPVEIVLPPGVYAPLPDNGTLSALGAQFRLRGEGQVEIRAVFTLLKGCRATFENLAIVPESGTAINLAHSELLLRDCEVRGGSLGILGTDCLLELAGSSVIGRASIDPGAAGVRCGGRSMLLARESRIECPGVAVAGLRVTLLESCVVVSADRNAIEGGNDSDLWVVGSLLYAKRAPFQRVARGLLEGVAVRGKLGLRRGGASGLRACFDHFRADGEAPGFGPDAWLDRCSLGR